MHVWCAGATRRCSRRAAPTHDVWVPHAAQQVCLLDQVDDGAAVDCVHVTCTRGVGAVRSRAGAAEKQCRALQGNAGHCRVQDARGGRRRAEQGRGGCRQRVKHVACCFHPHCPLAHPAAPMRTSTKEERGVERLDGHIAAMPAPQPHIPISVQQTGRRAGWHSAQQAGAVEQAGRMARAWEARGTQLAPHWHPPLLLLRQRGGTQLSCCRHSPPTAQEANELNVLWLNSFHLLNDARQVHPCSQLLHLQRPGRQGVAAAGRAACERRRPRCPRQAVVERGVGVGACGCAGRQAGVVGTGLTRARVLLMLRLEALRARWAWPSAEVGSSDTSDSESAGRQDRGGREPDKVISG